VEGYEEEIEKEINRREEDGEVKMGGRDRRKVR
jgi:hypothetical protein